MARPQARYDARHECPHRRVTFLAYIAAGITSIVLFRRATGGGVAAKLAGIAAHAADGVVQCFSAVLLAVTLYAITREQDGQLAMLGLVCRLGEGIIASLSIPAMLALFWLATASGADAPDTAAAHALAVLMWLPMLAFEVPLGLWLLTRGVATPARPRTA